MLIKIDGYWKDDKSLFTEKVVRLVSSWDDFDVEADNENDDVFFTAEMRELGEEAVIEAFLDEYGEASKEDWVATRVTHVFVCEGGYDESN